MSPSLHRRLRLARRWVWYGLAVGLVLAALLVGAVSQLLPLAERHPDRIAQWLGERIDRPVAFDRVETRWTRRGPLLRLDGLRLGEGEQAIRIGDAEMLISQYAGLLPGRSFTELRLRGLDLTLQRTADGRWEIRGLPGQEQAGGDPFAALEGLGELQVIDGKLAIVAPALHIDARLPRVDLRLRVDGDRVRVGMRAWMQSGQSPLRAVADFDRVRGDGRAHVGARDAQLQAWAPLLHAAGVSVEAGRGNLEAWARLRGHRVASALLDADLAGVSLRGAPLPGMHAPRTHLARLQALLRWQAIDGGWRVDAKRLRVGEGATLHTLDGLVLAGGERQVVLAERLDAAPMLEAAALSDRIDPSVRRWLLQARPRAVAHDLSFVAGRDGRVRASGRLQGVAMQPVGDAPGFSGLGGTLLGDARGVSVRFDPAAAVRIDWPRGFGVPHTARLRGTIAGWREEGGWRVGTQALQVRGPDLALDVRGGLWFPGDGTRPRIDLAADVGTTPVIAAKGFWIHHRMPSAAVRWLDAALQGGRIEGARAMVSGDLDDWPFRGAPGNPAHGLFEVRARIVDGTLKFQPDWPAATHVEADVAFAADGFHMVGEGLLGGVGVRHFDAGIEHFGKAHLQVRAQGGGDASRLLELLRQSPLQRDYGDTLGHLDASGLADVGFALDLPLHAGDGRAKIQGSVALAGARLAEKRWKLAFDDVRGRARYDGNGFIADGLAVRHEGGRGKLSLRAGSHARNPRNAFEAQLDTTLPAARLLQRVPGLSWLESYVSGRSDWSAQLSIPRGGARGGQAPPGRLRLQSSLAGTALRLPAPLRKDTDARLPATIETSLPIEAGEIRVSLGNRLGVRARSTGETGVRVVLGSDTVAQAPPASGLAIGGRADVLDAVEWIALAKAATQAAGDKAGNVRGGSGLPLREVDLQVDRLDLLGAGFPATRVRLGPIPGGLSARLDGRGLQGSVRIPDAGGATVSGRFQRVHWRAAPTSAGKRGREDPDADVDPAQLPPLSFDIADLRVGEALLGTTVLRTQPVPAGLRISQLQATAPGQRIAISGDWLGRGAAARTRVDVAVASDDFGALLGGFGYGGQLGNGEGQATLAANWPGGPSAFSLLALEGALILDVRDGQLTELEPGAGRVLGLLSIAQLPRRLSLDFRDFFSKGFAFDTLAGHMRLGNGRASSDDLVIAGPAAEIRIDGAADLRAQTFDQTIEVRPRAGNLLTVAGAIAGGPVGAAIGAAANAVLRKPLGQLAARTYRVTGPWKDPHVEVLGREPSTTAAADSPPPG